MRLFSAVLFSALSFISTSGFGDAADVEVLRCESAGKFHLSLVHTDTGTLIKLGDKITRSSKTFRLDGNVRLDFVNQSLALEPYILIFDDAKNPTSVEVARPNTSAISGISGKCNLKDGKLYKGIFAIGTLTIPDDIVDTFFAGDLVTIQFSSKKSASGELLCSYSFLGDRKKNCEWSHQDRTITVRYDSDGKARTHVFIADSDVKALVSRSATLMR